MTRILTISLLTMLTAAVAHADVVNVKGRGGKETLEGIKSEIDGIEVTWANIDSFVDQSTGIISKFDYDGIEIKKNEKAPKGKFFPWSQIAGHKFSTEPEELLDAYDLQATGNYAAAIREFIRIYQDKEVREVFRNEAYFQACLSYALSGKSKSAAANLAKWPESKSYYTPRAYQIVGNIKTSFKEFDQARDFYRKIAQLPGIPQDWEYKAKLGEVRVDIEEREFDRAIAAAKFVAGAAASSRELADVAALAYILTAKAIFAGGDDAKLGEAQQLLNQAAKLDGVSNAVNAELYAAMGDVIYKQGNPEKARFPYMRVVTMYPDEPEYVAHSLQNAGQCFLDLHGHAKNKGDMNASDQLLVKGMKLLYECAGRFGKTGSGSRARTTYRTNKAAMEEAEGRLKASNGGGSESAGGDEAGGGDD